MASDVYADMVAGTILTQELLVRFLEDEGVIEKGGFRFVLEAHLSNLSAKRRDDAKYRPMRALVKSLAKPAPRSPRKH